MATTYPVPIRIAQTVGITSTLVLSGASVALSIFFIPRALEAPTGVMLLQWRNMLFQAGKVIKNATLATAGLWFWLGWNAFQSAAVLGEKGISKMKGYVLAGACCVAIVPYTLIFLMPTNRKLLEKAEQARSLGKDNELVEIKGEQTAHQLVDKWGVLNLVRSALLISGGVVGMLTSME